MLKPSGPKETQDKWLWLVPFSIPKSCWPPGSISTCGSSPLLSPCPLSYTSSALGVPSPSFSFLYNIPMSAMYLPDPLSFIFLSLPFPCPLMAWSILLAMFCLLLSLPVLDASKVPLAVLSLICSLKTLSTKSQSGHTLTLYRSYTSNC